MRALILKELRGFLGSLIGQIVVVVFLLLTGLFLWVFPNNILDSGYADLGPALLHSTLGVPVSCTCDHHAQFQ
ncbi:MAG: hypothetical protein IPI91_04080 [Flavobacteriales bacterium]|nr:hypothetical protein [Flavobacteriales bacterium]